MFKPERIAVGSLSTKPVSKYSKMTGIPRKSERKMKEKLKIEKNNNGFSSLIKIKITFKILKPSLNVFSLLTEPCGLAL